MLQALAVVLLLAWGIGQFALHLGPYIHVLLLGGLVIFVYRLIIVPPTMR